MCDLLFSDLALELALVELVLLLEPLFLVAACTLELVGALTSFVCSFTLSSLFTGLSVFTLTLNPLPPPSCKSSKSTKNITALPIGSTKKLDLTTQSADLGYNHGLLTNKDFDDSQTLVGTSQKDEKTPWGPFTRALFTIIIVMIAILLTIVMLGAIGIAVLYKYKKRKNMELEEILVSRNSDMIGGGIDG